MQSVQSESSPLTAFQCLPATFCRRKRGIRSRRAFPVQQVLPERSPLTASHCLPATSCRRRAYRQRASQVHCLRLFPAWIPHCRPRKRSRAVSQCRLGTLCRRTAPGNAWKAPPAAPELRPARGARLIFPRSGAALLSRPRTSCCSRSRAPARRRRPARWKRALKLPALCWKHLPCAGSECCPLPQTSAVSPGARGGSPRRWGRTRRAPAEPPAR